MATTEVRTVARRLRDMSELLAIGRQVDPRLRRALLVNTVLTNVAMALRALWFKLLVDSILDGDTDRATVVAALLALSEFVRSWSLLRAQMQKMDLQDLAVQHFQAQTMEFVGSSPTIDHLDRQDYRDRLEAVRAGYPALGAASGTAADAVATGLRGIVTVALLATVSPLLVLLPIFAIPAVPAARRAQRIRGDGLLASMGATRLADHLHGLALTASPAKELRVFAAAGRVAKRQEAAWDDATHLQVGAVRRAELISFAGWACYLLGFGLSLAGTVWAVSAGRAGTGDLFLVIVLGSQISTLVATGMTLIGSLAEARTSLDDLHWLEHEASPPPTSSNRPVPASLARGIDVTSLTFEHPGAHGMALDGVDLLLPAGKMIALVGENGAGKSTLVDLLTGLRSPTSGSISVDDTDLAQLDPAAWRARICVGFQNFVRFELALQEAVGIGDLDRLEDPDAVLEALERADCADLVAKLPEGLETRLGLLSGGRDLSGGQWQKVSVARALMRRAPLLVVLDEPTAAMDPATEQRLFDRYAQAARAAAALGAVTLITSHRFSAVSRADLIVVLEGGRVVQVGTHAELRDAPGLYAELAGLQADAYR